MSVFSTSTRRNYWEDKDQARENRRIENRPSDLSRGEGESPLSPAATESARAASVEALLLLGPDL